MFYFDFIFLSVNTRFLFKSKCGNLNNAQLNFVFFSNQIFYQRKILNIQKSTKYNGIRLSNYSKNKIKKIKT